MSAISVTSLRTALLMTAVFMATLGAALHVGPAAAQTATPAPASAGAVARDTAVHPFRIDVPDAELAYLRRRIAMTRWSDRETVAHGFQGVQLAKFQELVRTWGTDYDWRKVEAKLNALPQFISTIDGVDIQFAHIRSPHPDAMPLIMTHGWPGSALELLKVIDPLTDPAAHGGRAEDAFHLVLPTYPGYGFSGKPTEAWDPGRVARAWDVLMNRLGYEHYVSQGGDWGAIISQVMAVQAPDGLLGIHTNMPGTTPPSVLRLIRNDEPASAIICRKKRPARLWPLSERPTEWRYRDRSAADTCCRPRSTILRRGEAVTTLALTNRSDRPCHDIASPAKPSRR